MKNIIIISGENAIHAALAYVEEISVLIPDVIPFLQSPHAWDKKVSRDISKPALKKPDEDNIVIITNVPPDRVNDVAIQLFHLHSTQTIAVIPTGSAYIPMSGASFDARVEHRILP